jgi:hypothetical protein
MKWQIRLADLDLSDSAVILILRGVYMEIPMGKKEEKFYSYPEQFRQLMPVDSRLQGLSIADWFRSLGMGGHSGASLQDCLAKLYGLANFRLLSQHFNTGSGYATSRYYAENASKRNAIQAELEKRFADYPWPPPPGTTYPP